MRREDKNLIKYIFILGITNENKQKIFQNELNNYSFLSPEILSCYSIENETQLFLSIKKNIDINKDPKEKPNNDLRNNIFPMKSDYLDKIIDPDFEEENISNVKSVFSDYIIKTKNNFPPEHFYHCFQYELTTDNSNDLILNFGVLIFYENIIPIEFQEKEEKNDDINIYLGKALIFVSEKPVFSLMKKILEKIYLDFIKPKYSFIYLEPFIINFVNSLNDNISKITFKNENMEINDKKLIDYCPFQESILPFCVLNIEFIFQLFDINDILLIAEYYFLTKSIIIVSPDCEILYPIYHILMTLFFPLNFHSKYYFYKLLNPDLVLLGINSTFSCFYFIYTDKNINNGYINDNIINKFVENKKEILIFQIVKNFDKENKYIGLNIEKNIYMHDAKEEKYSKIPTSTRKGNTLIENVMKNVHNNDYGVYTTIIKSEINNCKNNNNSSNNIIENIELDSESELDFSGFFGFSKNLSSLDIIRKNFLGLIIKFLVIKIKPFTFRYNDNGQLEICPLIIDENNENENEDENEDNNNNEEKESIQDFLDSPQLELIYKNGIIKLNYFNIDFLKTQLILDYFIKISKNDPNTLYFDEANFNNKSEENNNEKEKEKIEKNIKQKEKEISFEELFNYKKYMKSKIGIKNKLTKEEEKNFYKIVKIEKIKPYLDINEDIENNLVVFYNENFNLDFNTYELLLDQVKLYSKTTIIFNNLNDPIFINNKDKIKLKYYYLILYEAKIFKKIFYTINTVNRKELVACATGLYISLYILNLLSKKTDNEKEDKNLIDNIKTLFDKLFTLFTQTKCFYGKYNFITTLIYLIIIIYTPLKIEYIERFIFSLQELKNVPSLILILLYNNNIEFKLIKDAEIKPFKERKILYLEKIKHKHEFELEKILGDFICKNGECQEYMGFYIVNNITNKKDYQNALNPIYLIEKLLDKIEESNSLILPDIDYMDDIQQIAIWDEIYFNIRFFRDRYIDEIEY